MAWIKRVEKHKGFHDPYEAMAVDTIVDAVRAIKAHRPCSGNWCEDMPDKCAVSAHRCASHAWQFFRSEWGQFLIESLGQNHEEVLIALERFGSKVE